MSWVGDTATYMFVLVCGVFGLAAAGATAAIWKGQSGGSPPG